MESMAPDGCIKKTSRFARLDVYHPKNPNGQMVLICPGGAYWITATFSEGLYAAQWLTERGITAVVLIYRMPLKVANGAPLEDVHNAMMYCREHASEWGVKSNQIGIMGFSAGGHLAASGSVLYVDAQTRPDFSVLFYPVITFEDNITHNGTRTNLIDKKEYLKEYYSLENQINHNTPPAFILHSSDDNAVPVENSLRYYHNLVKMQVPAEMHIIPVGGHGWGFHDNSFRKDGKGDVIEQYRDVIYSALENFLKLQNK
jgi:acetyl esterase/lipase